MDLEHSIGQIFVRSSERLCGSVEEIYFAASSIARVCDDWDWIWGVDKSWVVSSTYGVEFSAEIVVGGISGEDIGST